MHMQYVPGGYKKEVVAKAYYLKQIDQKFQNMNYSRHGTDQAFLPIEDVRT